MMSKLAKTTLVMTAPRFLRRVTRPLPSRLATGRNEITHRLWCQLVAPEKPVELAFYDGSM
jgi:hypothetical protein